MTRYCIVLKNTKYSKFASNAKRIEIERLREGYKGLYKGNDDNG